ncbi:ABC transporter substrate-binding protein [Roseobacteraceae bacterium S113]
MSVFKRTVVATTVVWLACLFTNISAPTPAQAQTTKTPDIVQAITERKVLVVGSDVPYGIMEFYDEAGELTGIDITIAQRLAKDLDVDLMVKEMPFDQLFDALDSGRVDAIASAVTITQERQKSMLFSTPYMDAGMVVAVNAANTQINSPQDLLGKTLGVLSGTVGEDMMRKSDLIRPADLVVYQNNEARIDALITGKIDAAVVHFASDAVPGIRFVQPPLTQSYYGIVARKSDTALMERFNVVLRDLKRTGELDEIKRTFLNSSTE